MGSLIAQSNIPQLISFSAVVRDEDNAPLANTAVSIRLSFRQGGQEGDIIYCALHQDQTNANGFISIQLNRDVLGIGCNNAPTNSFEEIPWENGDFWMDVEYQTIPGNPFINLGQLELASSFYAFSAGTAERIEGLDLNGANHGDILTYDSNIESWIAIDSDSVFSDGFDGDYNSLDNKPDLSIYITYDSVLSEEAVDAMVSNNGYITYDSVLSEEAVDAMVSNNGYITHDSVLSE